MKRGIIILFFCITGTAFCPLAAFNWPVEEQRVSATFGQNAAGGFYTGINLLGRDEPVYPIAGGEIIFSYDEHRDYTSIPRGLGSFVILYHEGEIHSVYSHLKTGSREKTGTYQVSENTPLGIVGSTGATEGGSLFLQVYDMEENILLNPLINLNPEFEDNEKPVINEVFIRRDEETIELKNNAVIPPGPVSFLVQAFDTRQDLSRTYNTLGFSRIIMNRDGIEVSSIIFEFIAEDDKRLVLGSSRWSYGEVYEDRWLYNLGRINLIEGITRLQFLVFDYARADGKDGNRAVRDFVITVQNP